MESIANERNRAREGEAVRRDDADVGLDLDEAIRVEVLRIHDRRHHVREDLELGRDSHVVPIRADSIGDDSSSDLAVLEGLDHPVLPGHSGDPAIRLN